MLISLDSGTAAGRGTGGAGGLRRVVLDTGASETLIDGVADFECRVPPVPGGRDPDLVHLTLTLAIAGGEPVTLVTSAKLRPLDVRCPINR
ncbi:MAG: hypothetical protein HY815_12325 [Candidatus Riflebacteria bacterium]|nr:hypothetical protein [Candidatus Riflebacteria bacterium]